MTLDHTLSVIFSYPVLNVEEKDSFEGTVKYSPFSDITNGLLMMFTVEHFFMGMIVL